MALDSLFRRAQDCGDFGHLQPGEHAQFDYIRFDGILDGQLVEILIDQQTFLVLGRNGQIDGLNLDPPPSPFSTRSRICVTSLTRWSVSGGLHRGTSKVLNQDHGLDPRA